MHSQLKSKILSAVDGLMTQVEQLGDALQRAKLSRRSKILFYRQMLVSQKAGNSKQDALEKIRKAHMTAFAARYAKRGGSKPVLVRIAEDGIAGTRAGESLATSLARWLPKAELSVLAAGEESGTLVDAYARAIRLAKQTGGMWSNVIGASIYPAVLMTASAMGFKQFADDVLPGMGGAIKPDQAGTLGRWLYEFAPLVSEYWWPALLAIGLLTAAMMLSLPRAGGRFRMLLDHIPPWSLYRTVHGALFLSTFATLQRSGMSVIDALNTQMSTATPWLQERIRGALYGVRQGFNLGRSLINSGHNFPDRFLLPVLEDFADQAGYAEQLDELAQDWLAETAEHVQFLSKLIFWGGVAFAAFFILILAVGFIQLNSTIS